MVLVLVGMVVLAVVVTTTFILVVLELLDKEITVEQRLRIPMISLLLLVVVVLVLREELEQKEMVLLAVLVEQALPHTRLGVLQLEQGKMFQVLIGTLAVALVEH
jgi:hypothetical protein